MSEDSWRIRFVIKIRTRPIKRELCFRCTSTDILLELAVSKQEVSSFYIIYSIFLIFCKCKWSIRFTCELHRGSKRCIVADAFVQYWFLVRFIYFASHVANWCLLEAATFTIIKAACVSNWSSDGVTFYFIAAMSKIRMNFASESETKLNSQINTELHASYVYQSMVSCLRIIYSSDKRSNKLYFICLSQFVKSKLISRMMNLVQLIPIFI